jgi:LCP family protein required for cell wall assembly
MSEGPIRHRAKPSLGQRARRLIGTIAASTAVVLVSTSVVAGYAYLDLSNGIRRAAVSLPTGSATYAVAPEQRETNILVMGLDSRVDLDGNPLPPEMYEAIRAGDQSDGGYNANVLMLIHIPAGGGRAVGISIPRDDYVPLAGAPDGVSSSKIKEAYGLAFDETFTRLRNEGVDSAPAYQQARDAARQTEIQTVSDFLGGVPIDHFIEITMAAFYSVAQAVQPITVCLNHATQDKYSGADFPAGVQDLDAQQAMSFVRQRRDTGPSDLELTDLDRTRRQQAFIVALAYKLRQAGTFSDVGTLRALITTAKQYIAVDEGFDLLSFAGQASRLAGGGITFQTLPIAGFETIDGKDVNVVDTEAIRSLVAGLIADTPSPTASAPASSATPAASPTAAATASAAVPDPQETYANAESPLQAGGIPCVN